MESDPVFTGKQQLILHSLKAFFSNQECVQVMAPIVNGIAPISLRLLEWFVTNYSKKHNTFYTVEGNNGIMNHFFVFLNYKLQLKAYSKKEFDPFCRRGRIQFYYNDTEYIVTTIGQLNFFRWAISQKIIDFVTDNRDIIEQDMNHAIRQAYGSSNSKKNSDGGTTATDSLSSTSFRKKRRELSESVGRKR